MGKIFYILGKSASGKDSIYTALLAKSELGLRKVITYTTRPMRVGEKDGEEYFFVSDERIEELRGAGRIIEEKTYNTVYGPWIYATVDDGQIDLSKGNYLMASVLGAYIDVRNYYGAEHVIPIYIEVEDGERLIRAIERERKGDLKFEEMCRRFLADTKDFSEENLEKGGIKKRFENDDYDRCVTQIADYIKSYE